MRRLLFALLTLALLHVPAFKIHASTDEVWLDDLTAGTPSYLVGDATRILDAAAPRAAAFLGDWAQAGAYLSPVHPFPKLVAAVTLDTDTTVPVGAAVRLDVRGQNPNGAWQMWHHAPRGEQVTFDQPTRIVQFRLTLLTNAASPRARSVAVTAQWNGAHHSIHAESVAPTYRIFATREGLVGHRTANGHVIRSNDHFVALPSWRALSSRGGYEYQVRISYNGRSAVVPVWDVGPWNTRDDYWSTNREMWRDLPRGVPEAQAAKLDGYNGGRDERGRRPNLPNGIDIADGTFWELGIPDNAWVEVTFLWEGADPGAAAPPPPADTPPAPPAAPAPDGALVVDNSDAGFKAISGTWFDGTCGVNTTHRWTYSARDQASAANVAEWIAPIPTAGSYELFVFIPACGKPATHAATYTIQHDSISTNVLFDQEAHQNAWYSLGTYRFQPGNRVTLRDMTGEQGLAVRYDALAWVPRTATAPPMDTTPPMANVSAVRNLGSGRYDITWQGNDDGTGIADFDVQVQRDGGAWRDWLLATPELSATFLVDDVLPAVYGFRVRARDWAGNQSAYPANAQQTTIPALR